MKWPCRHKYGLAGCFRTEVQCGYSDCQVTIILYRCREPGCGKLKTKRVDGHWTVDEIEGRTQK